MANENEPAKLLLPYLQRADELQKHEPLVAYYCRLCAMQRGLKIPTSDRTKTTNALLVSLMNQLEKDKKSLKLGPDDHLHLEGFASSVFAKADKQDRAGRADLDDLTEDGFYDRTGPWLDQGLCLVDWGRGIDLSLFPDEIKFYGDCRTSGFRCVEMQEKKPWTFQVDIYGLCVIVHMMLHNSYMEVEKKASPDGGYIYKPKSYFKRNTAKTFYAASIFFEIRNQFGDFQPDLEQKQKYAAWKAADIRKALKEGRKPIPGPADGDKDLSILSSTSSGEYDLEPSRSDPVIKPALEPDQSHQSYDEIPPSPSNNSSSLPSYPTASYPSHDFLNYSIYA